MKHLAMPMPLLPVLLGAICLIPPAMAQEILVSSSFDSDADGWTGVTVSGSPSWDVLTALHAVTHDVGDGQPAGSIRLVDPNTDWTYFRAPAKFLGNQSAALGGALTFASRWVVAGSGGFVNEAEVVLKGAGLSLTYDATNSLPAVWTDFTLPLVAGAWRVADSFSGVLASPADLLAVLSDLDELWINAEHFTPVDETIALDNVRLLSPVPEPGAWLMLLAGLGLTGLVSRRRKG